MPPSEAKITNDWYGSPAGCFVIGPASEAMAGVVPVPPTTRRHVTSPTSTMLGSKLVNVNRACPRAAVPVELLRALP